MALVTNTNFLSLVTKLDLSPTFPPPLPPSNGIAYTTPIVSHGVTLSNAYSAGTLIGGGYSADSPFNIGIPILNAATPPIASLDIAAMSVGCYYANSSNTMDFSFTFHAAPNTKFYRYGYTGFITSSGPGVSCPYTFKAYDSTDTLLHESAGDASVAYIGNVTLDVPVDQITFFIHMDASISSAGTNSSLFSISGLLTSVWFEPV